MTGSVWHSQKKSSSSPMKLARSSLVSTIFSDDNEAHRSISPPSPLSLSLPLLASLSRNTFFSLSSSRPSPKVHRVTACLAHMLATRAQRVLKPPSPTRAATQTSTFGQGVVVGEGGLSRQWIDHFWLFFTMIKGGFVISTSPLHNGTLYLRRKCPDHRHTFLCKMTKLWQLIWANQSLILR